RPDLVSFHFGLPEKPLFDRVRSTGARILGNATTLIEGLWLQHHGCDAIIVQGEEAGGHAGWFLDGHQPLGMLSLLRQLDECVAVPLIAAGGVGDGETMAAAVIAGANGGQIGTAYLACPESLIGDGHRALLGTAAETVFTNVLTGRVARGFRNRLIDAVGPMNEVAPPFPYASNALAPLQAKTRADFGPLWAGQGAMQAPPMPARDRTERLARIAMQLLGETP
ncbi:NAD(P)H-dependent flavin oxidoreductase, partial [Sphingomonas turrisvirgatae]|uniref:NAD(P)H-dependent flavin oxidoreductase n=1 Tax=Sphingomonas turrisvirgatae TaxID=1888892 RepID=UPI00156B0D94